MPSSTIQPDRERERRAIIIALIVGIAAFMQMLDTTIISTAIPGIAKSFHVDAVMVGSGVVVYVLAASVMIPASAWLADRLGAKRLFLSAMVGFTIASILCGMCKSLEFFIAARAIQGVTGALMGAVGQLILLSSVDRTSLLKVVNISTTPMLVAPVLGPPLGGFITDTLGWEWIFYLNLPVGLIGLAAAWWFLDSTPIKRRPFDGVGFALNAIALTAVLIGLEQMSHGSFWAGTIVVAVGLGVGALAIRHLKRHDHPILSLAPFRHQTFRVASGIALPFVRLPIGALAFAVPLLLQICFGYSAFWSGMALFAHAVGDLLVKLVMTQTFRRFGYRRILMITVILMSSGIIGMALVNVHTPLVFIMLLLFFTGCVRSYVMGGLNTLAFADVLQEEAGSAVTVNQVMMQLAGALSVSLTVLLIQASQYFRSAGGNSMEAVDVHIAFAVLGMAGFACLPWLWNLPKNAGHQLTKRS